MRGDPMKGQRYFVRLAAVGNPDFGEYYGEGVLAPTKKVPVASIEQASEVCQAYIVEHQLGGGNWAGGEITDSKGKKIAEVSYNGRVWKPDGWRDGEKPLYEPARRRPWFRPRHMPQTPV